MVTDMRARATSFAARGESPTRVARRAAEAAQAVVRPSAALIFVSGVLGGRLADLAGPLSHALPDIPVLVASGHGVLSERGELEGETAASGVIWSGGSSEAVAADSAESDVGVALAKALAPRARGSSSAFVFARPRGFSPQTLEPLVGQQLGALVGGGTTGDSGVLVMMPGRPPQVSDAGALVCRAGSAPVVRASAACRLLSPLSRITSVRGPMVLELEGQTALEALSSATRTLTNQPLVFVALATEEDNDDGRAPLLLRGIQGVDPARQGVLVSEEVRHGMRMGFAVRDAAAARVDLESTALRVARDAAGAAACFGVYMSCAGRGKALYGTSDVDVRILKHRFPSLPIAGMHSSFEIAPHAGVPSLQLYTGVMALFTAPS